MTLGTGPKTVPASDVNVPAWTSATLGLPAAQIRAPVDGLVQRFGAALGRVLRYPASKSR